MSSLADGPLLVVSPTSVLARELADALTAWTDHPISVFPALEVLPYERGRLDRSVLGERQTTLQQMSSLEPGIVIAPARALLQPVEGQSVDHLQPIRLLSGEQIELERLVRQIISAGYSEAPMVDEAATFARRGGLIDIFPLNARAPVRVELFGTEIESLRSFDAATQLSTGTIAEAIIPPIGNLGDDARLAALEALMDVGTSSLTAEARAEWQAEIDLLEGGAPLDELGFALPYLISRPVSVAEQLKPETTVILMQGAGEALVDLEDQARAVVEERVSARILPPGLRPALVPSRAVNDSLRRRRVFELHAGSAELDEDIDVSELMREAPQYAGRLRSLADDIKNHDQAVVIASQQADRIAELLAEDDLIVTPSGSLDETPAAGVSLVRVGADEGFELTNGPVILTDHEIFGRAVTHHVARKPRQPRDAFFVEFGPGDYVVHLEHGVGRFDGMIRMKVDGAEREYALVQFAGADRVYVPGDQLERLTRYIGVGEGAPKLNKLGGAEWQRARQRAKAAAEDIAEELVEIYAKRLARPGHSFAGDTPWQAELEASFGFPETAGQVTAVEEVKRDLEAPRPMDRLICADVGYGKTEVAIRAAFKAIMEGRQVAVLAPTTILTQQHLETFQQRLSAFPVKIEVLNRFRSASEQRDVLLRLASGEVDVLIGTHRLLQKDVRFKQLGLLVVDEEQRFGVRHKEHLKKLRETVDTLTLTATPIPRTLHTTLVGIREVSVIETPPEGRLPVKTYLQPFDERLVREAILRELDREGQVYIVH
ncbi:MAG: DEAD/DEAH box helicase, partial [Chloroflexota bacterium]